MSFIDPNTITSWISSPYALAILSALSLSESAFFFIPPEVILLPMALANPQAGLWYGVLATITSVIGAAVGYFIGKKGGKPILDRLFSKKKVETVRTLFQRYGTKAIFISAFTPIPFKIFTIAGGVFDLDFKRFLFTSLLGRGTRYMLLSSLIFVFGEPIRYFLEHQLDKVVLFGTVFLITSFAFYKFLWPMFENKVFKPTLKEKFIRIFKRS